MGNGMTASIPGRKVALITYSGWDSLHSKVHQNVNAEVDESTVLFAYRKRIAKDPAMELMISVMLHKTDDGAWAKEELSPVENVKVLDVMPSGSVLGAEITSQAEGVLKA